MTRRFMCVLMLFSASACAVNFVHEIPKNSYSFRLPGHGLIMVGLSAEEQNSHLMIGGYDTEKNEPTGDCLRVNQAWVSNRVLINKLEYHLIDAPSGSYAITVQSGYGFSPKTTFRFEVDSESIIYIGDFHLKTPPKQYSPSSTNVTPDEVILTDKGAEEAQRALFSGWGIDTPLTVAKRYPSRPPRLVICTP